MSLSQPAARARAALAAAARALPGQARRVATWRPRAPPTAPLGALLKQRGALPGARAGAPGGGPRRLTTAGPETEGRGGQGGAGEGAAWWRQAAALGVGAFCAAACAGDGALNKLRVDHVIPVDNIESVFKIEEQLGEGGFSVVYRAIVKETGKAVAMKIMDKNNPETVLVMQDEVEIMRAAGLHENMVSLHATYETPHSYCLILDLANGGALFDRVVDEGSLTEAEASQYILQITEALLHMHRRRICHGDVKPENLLLTSDDPNASIKICDFGMARFISDKQTVKLNQNTGTMDYWAPEIVKNGQCGQAIDMWALGVVTYIMLCGCNPFDPHGGASDAEILTNISKGNYDKKNPVWRVLSPQCKDLILKMLEIDAEKRITAEEALQHPWLCGGQASHKLLPKVHQQRLLGYQALTHMRNIVHSLHINTDNMYNEVMGGQQGKSGMHAVDLKVAFKSVGQELSMEAVRAVMDIADVSGDGVVDRDEFKRLMKASRDKEGTDLTDEQLKLMFKLFDEDNDGFISPQEMKHVLGMMGRKMSLRRASSIVNKNASVSLMAPHPEGLTFKDFKKIMRNHIFADDKDE